MATTFSSAFKSFWHTMTSYDRHSSYDSPIRTGRHVPLNQQGRMGVLTSVATASESRADVSSPYADEGRSSTGLQRSSTAYEGAGASPTFMNPGSRPYSPGLRSESARRQSRQDGYEMNSPTGEIPMQSFEDGLPPPPPVSHSWGRIDSWAEENYPELFDQLCEGCTSNDINELEHQLDTSLPDDVRHSWQIHDGQERGGIPTGIIFGCMLVDCEEMVQEWDNWRKVNQEFLLETTVVKPAAPVKALGGTSSSQASSSKATDNGSPAPAQNPMWRQDLMAKQDCVPPNAVQKAYAHPAWIPLVRDWGGNNLAVDLSPGPTGTWGQIILFGRDYDTKYVIARSWAAFLALVADDLNSGKWFIDEDTRELKLREFKTTRVEPGYFDILRWRMDQKYGRRAAKRKSTAPRANGTSPLSSPGGSAAGSPYASPVEMNGEPRGRPLQRLSLGSPLASPNRPGYGKPSPLSRVTEEMPLPELTIPNGKLKDKAKEKLVEVETPRTIENTSENLTPRLVALSNGTSFPATKGAAPTTTTTTTTQGQPVKENGRQLETADEAMKTIEI